MSETRTRVHVDEVDWSGILPFTRLFRSFRMAIDPSRLAVALLMIVLLYVCGRVLDGAWGPRVYNDEILAAGSGTAEEFHDWLKLKDDGGWELVESLLPELVEDEAQRERILESSARVARTETLLREDYERERHEIAQRYSEESQADTLERNLRTIDGSYERTIEALAEFKRAHGIFDEALTFKVKALKRMAGAALNFDFGLRDLLDRAPTRSDSVLGALRDVVIVLPTWMYRAHPGFFMVYGIICILVWGVFGGALSHMHASHATRDQPVGFAAAMGYGLRRAGWFIFTPMLPYLVAGLLGLLVISGGGLVFFGIPGVHWVTDVFGGLLFFIAIICGFLIAMVILLTATAGNLFYPALAVEDSDTFDVISRTFSYVLYRPWRWLFYTVVSILYGALTYVFVATVALLTLSVTRHFVQLLVWLKAGGEAGEVYRIDVLFPEGISQMNYAADWSQLGLTGKVAAALIWVWVLLVFATVGAFAINIYLSTQTWTYLLLRRAAEGTDYSETGLAPPSTAPDDSHDTQANGETKA